VAEVSKPAPQVSTAQTSVSHAPAANNTAVQTAAQPSQQKAVEIQKPTTVAVAPAPASAQAQQPVAPQKTVVHVAPVLNAKKNCRAPEYPDAAAMRHETGTVVLNFLVDTDGTVKDSQVAVSSGHPILDNSALKALRTCKFVSGTADGVPEAAWTKIKFAFQGS
jgi:protein TonB